MSERRDSMAASLHSNHCNCKCRRPPGGGNRRQGRWQLQSGRDGRAMACAGGVGVSVGCALAGELAPELRTAIDGFSAHRRVALGYLRTDNPELAAIEIEQMRDRWQQDMRTSRRTPRMTVRLAPRLRQPGKPFSTLLRKRTSANSPPHNGCSTMPRSRSRLGARPTVSGCSPTVSRKSVRLTAGSTCTV